jgi:hypothetical protein
MNKGIIVCFPAFVATSAFSGGFGLTVDQETSR